jgi:hypothetical protein
LLINKGILVCNKGVGHSLAYKVNSKATLVYSLDLFKWVSYKANNSIKFKGVKRSAFFNLFLNLLFTLFY